MTELKTKPDKMKVSTSYWDMEQADIDAIISIHCYRVESITVRRSIDMHHTTNTSRAASMSELRYEYREWLYENNLPKMSAGNLLNEEGLSKEQRAYLKSFIVRWVSTPAR